MLIDPIPQTDKNLRSIGAKPMARWLIQAAIDEEKKYITYGEASARLEQRYHFNTIPRGRTGEAADAAMKKLHGRRKGLPLISVLLVEESTKISSSGPDEKVKERFHYISELDSQYHAAMEQCYKFP